MVAEWEADERKLQSAWATTDEQRAFLESIPVNIVPNDTGNQDDGFNWGTQESETYMEWLTGSDPTEHPDKSYRYFKENIKPCLERIKEL